MKKELEGLHRDHRNITQVLDAINATLKMNAADEDWVCRYLGSAVAYLGGFERDMHHRKEDGLFRRLLALDGSMREVHAELLKHRNRLAEMEKDIQSTLRGIQSHDPESTRHLKQQVAEYIEAYRNCMAVEEGSLYWVAMERLLGRDWRETCGRFADVMDPVFGPEATRKYGSSDAALLAYGASRHH